MDLRAVLANWGKGTYLTKRILDHRFYEYGENIRIIIQRVIRDDWIGFIVNIRYGSIFPKTFQLQKIHGYDVAISEGLYELFSETIDLLLDKFSQ